MKYRFKGWTSAGALFVFLVSTGSVFAQTAFMTRTDRAPTVAQDRSDSVVRTQNVRVDTRQLTSKNRRLKLTIFDGKPLDLVMDRTERISGNGLIWYGKIANEPRSSVILTLVGEAVAGNIDTASGKVYQIRFFGNGVHSLREIDRTKFPNEGAPLIPLNLPMLPDADTCATDPPTDIDVLVVYTPAARLGAGGQDAMVGTAYLAVAETNQTYLNSNVSQRLRLAHVEEISYTETGAFNTDLTRLQNPSDTYMDNVQTLRNTHAADVVSLITETGDYCGLGYGMSSLTNAFESYAYSVVRRDCATGYFSFGHELGHNMGAGHDVANQAGGLYPYAHGSFNSSTAPLWRTVMTYQTTPATARVPYWSNPDITYPGGGAMGDAATTDNAHVLNNTALTVANFRCSSPGVNNVWMKDTWNDTGLEPDPHTNGEAMYQSPYIWVRNTQDSTFVHQHEHQNPEFGSSNWVYVKLHNGGSAPANGALEVYWADASTSTVWTSGWNLLSSVPVSAFAGHSTKIVEVPWVNLPGTGHFCLVARWNSGSDPMTTPEGTDINANVHANNNLVWRNLNIVDLLPDAAHDVTLNVNNPDREIRAIELSVRSISALGKPSFLHTGKMWIELDETLMKAWRAGGSRGTGFRTQGNRIFVSKDGASFSNLILPYGHGGRVKLTFARSPSTPKGEYLVDFAQHRATKIANAKKLSTVVGGVGYIVRTIN